MYLFETIALKSINVHREKQVYCKLVLDFFCVNNLIHRMTEIGRGIKLVHGCILPAEYNS